MRLAIIMIIAIAIATITPFASVNASHSADPILIEGNNYVIVARL